MKFVQKRNSLLLCLFIIFASACNSNRSTLKTSHEVLQDIFKRYVQSAQEVIEQVSQNKDSDNPQTSKLNQILYVPKIAKQDSIPAFLKQSSHFYTLAEQAYQAVQVFGFIYAFDNHSKSLLIYPKTEMKTLFGPNLDFTPFIFNQQALKAYPNMFFSDARNDINGTGKILILSQAKKNELGDHIVYAADLNSGRMKEVMIDHLHELNQQGKKDFFFWIYSSTPKSRLGFIDYSNNKRLWLKVKQRDNITFIDQDFTQKLADAENSNNSKLNATFSGKTFNCLHSNLKDKKWFLLTCLED